MKKFKLNQLVNCPADRGEEPYMGKITFISEQIYKNIDGVEYQ